MQERNNAVRLDTGEMYFISAGEVVEIAAVYLTCSKLRI